MIDQPPAPLPKPPLVYTLRVVLRGVSPLIWRHLLVPEELTLGGLHATLQLAFGWTDYHLHEIRIHGRAFGSMAHDPASARLSDFRLRPRERFSYVYDLTDYWRCDVRLLEVQKALPGKVYPVCVDGGRAAPPEGCGGAAAYMNGLEEHRLPMDELGVLVAAMQRVRDADGDQSVREAVGDLEELRDAVDRIEAYGAFKPERFVRRELNARLRTVDLEGRRP
jgi:hypothetical protein